MPTWILQRDGGQLVEHHQLARALGPGITVAALEIDPRIQHREPGRNFHCTVTVHGAMSETQCTQIAELLC